MQNHGKNMVNKTPERSCKPVAEDLVSTPRFSAHDYLEPLTRLQQLNQAHAAILELRALHRALDQAVLTAYAWRQPGPDGPAIDLAHAFQQVETLPENDRTRYTITPKARKDLLTRLLKLNHHRAAVEAQQSEQTSGGKRAVKTNREVPQRMKTEDELI